MKKWKEKKPKKELKIEHLKDELYDRRDNGLGKEEVVQKILK